MRRLQIVTQQGALRPVGVRDDEPPAIWHRPLPRYSRAGIFNSRQIALADFDQIIHTSDQASSRAVFNATMTRMSHISTQAGTSPAARFNHMVGYDAKYYA